MITPQGKDIGFARRGNSNRFLFTIFKLFYNLKTRFLFTVFQFMQKRSWSCFESGSNGLCVFAGRKTELMCDHFRLLGFPGGLTVKNLPAVQETEETQVGSLGREDPLQEGMATHSSLLAWGIPWTQEPGGLQSVQLQTGTTAWRLSTQTLCHWKQRQISKWLFFLLPPIVSWDGFVSY